MSDNNNFFPKIAESNWWKLRNLFKQKVPALVTTTYLSSSLEMTEQSARGNIIIPFKKLGIIEDDGKPTDLAYNWRDDSKYSEVCQKLLEKIYPQEVRDLFQSPESDSKGLTNWFMSYSRCGENTAKMFAAFYRLLLKADPSPTKEQGSQRKKSSISTKPLKERATKAKSTAMASRGTGGNVEEVVPFSEKTQSRHGNLPQLHINIQLHISPETTTEQIDKIFESMARHLKDFKF